MRKLTEILCAALVAAGVAQAAPAQGGGTSVSAQLQTGLVKLGSQAVAEVTVEGTTRARLLGVDPVDGLEFIGASGPKRSVFESISAGRRVRSETLSWTLHWRPERVGSYEIPPVRVEVEGVEVKTQGMSLRVVEDFQGQSLGYLEWIDAPTEIYEGQPFEVRLRFGWEWAMTRFNHANLILPWWGRLSGTLEVSAPSPVGQRQTDVSLNDSGVVRVLELGRQQLDGRELRMFELRRTFVSTRTGSLSFPASHFEFGRVDRGFFESRREIYYVAWPAFEVLVRALPEEGRPFEFSGGVGRFSMRSSVDRRSLDLGESVKLRVEWSGTGNLEFFEPPDLGREDAFGGFHSYGATDRFQGDRRVVIYDLAPKHAQIAEIPPVSLSIFDPERGVYTSIETAPIPIRIRVPEGFVGLDIEGKGETIGLDLRDISTAPRSSGGREGPSDLLLMGLPVATLLGWIALRRGVRRRGDPASARTRRRRRARKLLKRRLGGAREAREQAEALRLFLGDRTDEAETAWEGRDVRQYAAQRSEVDSGAVVAIAALMEELDASIWSGEGKVLETVRILGVADEALGGGL
jgi:hypothetical protein